MRYSKIIFSTLSFVLVFALAPLQSNAKGNLGMTAAIGLPSGITPAAGLPTNITSRITISTVATSSFNIMLSDAFQLDLGLGYLSVAPENGEASNTVSFGAGGKYFLDNGDVKPYINAGFSFTQIPTTETEAMKTDGSMITFLAAFGAQAFINSSNSVALFVQMGLGYNMGTLTTESKITGVGAVSSTTSNLNLGGSAAGVTVYF